MNERRVIMVVCEDKQKIILIAVAVILFIIFITGLEEDGNVIEEIIIPII